MTNPQQKTANKHFKITSFYHLKPQPSTQLKALSQNLARLGKDHHICGLILLSVEGINATVASHKPVSLSAFLKKTESLIQIQNVFYKHSRSQINPFKSIRVKIKDSIINSGKTSPPLLKLDQNALTPYEWEKSIHKKGVQILDIRNTYEVDIGTFNGAVHLGLKEFKNLKKSLQKLKKINKKVPALIYCTGGIRCEKAIDIMHEEGFSQVLQLQGGILNYLKSYPNKNFSGECFVFDRRVALDQHLMPSKKYTLCPHCGEAAGEHITCLHCKKECKICKTCKKKKTAYLNTCTKNCAYHYKMKNKCKRPVKHP